MSNRIQREVEELLDKLEKFPPKRPLSSRIVDALTAPFRAIGRAYRSLSLPRISAGTVLLAALIVIVTAYVLGGMGDASRWIIAGGIIVFIGAFVFSLRRQSRPQEKYWRDKPLDLNQKSSWWDNWRNKRR